MSLLRKRGCPRPPTRLRREMEEEAWILLFEVVSASSSIRDCHISLHSVCSCGLLLMMKAVQVCGELLSVCVTGINLISLLVTCGIILYHTPAMCVLVIQWRWQASASRQAPHKSIYFNIPNVIIQHACRLLIMSNVLAKRMCLVFIKRGGFYVLFIANIE